VFGLSPGGVAFLDRDGTINEKAGAGEYVTDPGQLRVLDGASRAVRRLNDAGVSVIVVTNQRGIALGRMSESDLEAVHARLRELLDAEAGARIDAIFHCPHERGTCGCRKPAPGLLLEARERWPGIDLAASVMIGDSPADVEAGRAVGASTVLLGEGAPDLAAAVDLVLGASVSHA
jgi:D-glycero-D-manno-heptose 1,7-bisphosphate phosphatase